MDILPEEIMQAKLILGYVMLFLAGTFGLLIVFGSFFDDENH